MAERDFAEIARLSEKYSKDPKSRIFVQLADAYRKNGMMDEALEILNKGLQYHPDYALGFLILGKCYYDQRKFEQAKDAFETTLKHDPQNIVALRMIAQICESTKDENGQISAYKGILALDPFDASAKEKLSSLESLRKKQPVYTISIAQEYEKQGNLKKALEVYEHLAFTDPSDLLLKEKINFIRSKLSTDAKRSEQQKIEELQVETFFKPEQVDIAPPEVTEPSPGATDTIQASELLEPAAPDVSNEDVEPIELKEVEEIQAVPKSDMLDKTGPDTEEDRGLDILQPVESQPMEETTQTIDIIKPADTVIPATQTAQEMHPEEVIESGDLLEPVIESEEVQPIQLDEVMPDQGVEQGSMTEKPPESTTKPAPTVAKKPPEPAPKPTRIISEKPLEPTPKPAPTVIQKPPEPPPKPAPSVAKKPPEPAPEPLPTEEVKSEPISEKTEPGTRPEEAPEKAEAAGKPKEEDFKSFQDWLSGLLK